MPEILHINHADYPANCLPVYGSDNDLNEAVLGEFNRRISWWQDTLGTPVRESDRTIDTFQAFVEAQLQDELMDAGASAEYLARLIASSGGPTAATLAYHQQLQDKIAVAKYALHPRELWTKTKGPFSLPRGMSPEEVDVTKKICQLFIGARTLFDLQYAKDPRTRKYLSPEEIHKADLTIDHLIMSVPGIVRAFGPQEAQNVAAVYKNIEWILHNPIAYYKAQGKLM